MKRNTIILFAILSAFSAMAQNNVSISDFKFLHDGDLARLEFQIDLSKSNVHKRSFVLLVPVIEQGNMSKELPAVMINGKVRHKAYLRMVSMRRGPVGIGTIINAAGSPKIHYYSKEINYEPWMEEANISIREDLCNCGNPLVSINNHRLREITPLSSLSFITSFREPLREGDLKTRSETGTAYLDFELNSSRLVLNFRNNTAELAKIGDMIRKAKNNPAITITKITMDGWASPDGITANNITLSNQRVLALKNYLRTTYNLDEKLLETRSHGEDWETLVKLLTQSNLSYKNEMLRIIRTVGLHDGRKTQMMNFQSGVPYKDMLENLYPKLRRADYEMQYTVIAFSVEEGKKVLETDPKLLSLEEMYAIAKTYPENSVERRRAISIAANTFPNNDLTNLNAAAIALDDKDPDAAQWFLEKMQNRDAAYDNNLGVLHVLRNDPKKAAELFRKAAAAGNSEAPRNLTELNKAITNN